ncbi:MAG: M48 family metallopeptidase [Paludibacterium sp.]|nr:M48 family metallopeptidase [Paludibacterium sp.]MBV8648492.1 M48 family metallopeptidase [Paludibacterium sp.]
MVVVRRARKSIGIRVRDSHVELVAPARVPLTTLQRVLDEKADWIWRHWQRCAAQAEARAHAPSSVWLQGREVPLCHDPAALLTPVLTGGGLVLGGAAHDLRARVAHFLFGLAAEQFPRHWRRLAPLAAREPGQLLLSSARTRWGSCHRDGRIRLNWRLIQAPPAILDYVIAHELAHLLHMNHSVAFWQETARLYPDWRIARAWLRREGERLFDFG